MSWRTSASISRTLGVKLAFALFPQLLTLNVTEFSLASQTATLLEPSLKFVCFVHSSPIWQGITLEQQSATEHNRHILQYPRTEPSHVADDERV